MQRVLMGVRWVVALPVGYAIAYAAMYGCYWLVRGVETAYRLTLLTDFWDPDMGAFTRTVGSFAIPYVTVLAGAVIAPAWRRRTALVIAVLMAAGPLLVHLYLLGTMRGDLYLEAGLANMIVGNVLFFGGLALGVWTVRDRIAVRGRQETPSA